MSAGNYCGNECGFDVRPKRLIARVSIDGTELMVLPKDKIVQNIPQYLTQEVTNYICNVSQRRYEKILKRKGEIPDMETAKQVEKENPLEELEKRLPVNIKKTAAEKSRPASPEKRAQNEESSASAQLQLQEQGVLEVAMNITHTSYLRQADEYLQAKMSTTGITPAGGKDLMVEVESLYSRCFSNNLLRPEELVRREAKNALLNKMNKVKLTKGQPRKVCVPQEAKVDIERLSSRGLSRLKEICMNSPRSREMQRSMTYYEMSVDSSSSHRAKSERIPRDFIVSGVRSSSKRSISRGETTGFPRTKLRLDGRSMDAQDLHPRHRPFHLTRPGPFTTKEQSKEAVGQQYYTATRKGFPKLASTDTRSTELEAASKTFNFGSSRERSSDSGQNQSKIHIQLCK